MSELRYVIDICGLEEGIRCAICENPMHTDKGCDGNCKYNEKAFKRITDLLDKRIELLPIAPEPHWIPCSERLPKDDAEVIVLCTDDSGDYEYSYVTVGWHYKGLWVVDNERCYFVRAWQPLPEPYKGVTE